MAAGPAGHAHTSSSGRWVLAATGRGRRAPSCCPALPLLGEDREAAGVQGRARRSRSGRTSPAPAAPPGQSARRRLPRRLWRGAASGPPELEHGGRHRGRPAGREPAVMSGSLSGPASGAGPLPPPVSADWPGLGPTFTVRVAHPSGQSGGRLAREEGYLAWTSPRSTSSTPSRPTDLVVTDLVEGDGPEAAAGNTVEVHYVGRRALDRRGVRRVVQPRRAAAVPPRRRPGHLGLGHRACRA